MAEISRDALLDNFERNLASVGAYCTVVRNKGEAADTVRSVIQKVAARHVAVSDSILVSSILPADVAVEFIANAPADILFDCDLGITSAQWAIAETGTLVLESDAETSRLTSLVPRVHLCIIEAGKIRQTLGEILSLTQRPLSPAITFITGASRTSDIELTLAIGFTGRRNCTLSLSPISKYGRKFAAKGRKHFEKLFGCSGAAGRFVRSAGGRGPRACR